MLVITADSAMIRTIRFAETISARWKPELTMTMPHLLSRIGSVIGALSGIETFTPGVNHEVKKHKRPPSKLSVHRLILPPSEPPRAFSCLYFTEPSTAQYFLRSPAGAGGLEKI
jgi:hypothetical protein